MTKRKTGYNSTYKKLAVQWLNEALFFVSSFVVVDSLVLRNRQLLVAAKRVCLESMFLTNIECFTKDGRQLR
jgi:uncharacterized membrane protein SirB2